MEPTATAILLAASGGLLIVAVALSPVSRRLGVPALLILLGIGMAAGSEGLGGIPFDDYGLAFRLGTVALVLILFDGGLDTPVAVFRRVALPALLLATVAVVLTTLVTAAVGVGIGLPPRLAVLIGAVVARSEERRVGRDV